MRRRSVAIVREKFTGTAGEVSEAVPAAVRAIRSEPQRVLRDAPHELTPRAGKLLGFSAGHPGATLRERVARFSRDKGQPARLIRALKNQDLLSAEGARLLN